MKVFTGLQLFEGGKAGSPMVKKLGHIRFNLQGCDDMKPKIPIQPL